MRQKFGPGGPDFRGDQIRCDTGVVGSDHQKVAHYFYKSLWGKTEQNKIHCPV